MLCRRIIRPLPKPLCEYFRYRFCSDERSLRPKEEPIYYLSENLIQRRKLIEARVIEEKTPPESIMNHSFQWFDPGAPKETDFAWGNLRNWWDSILKFSNEEDQRYLHKRVEVLGYDLGAAHFVIQRGGRVKFHGRPNWFEIKKRGDVCPDLPNTYNPDYLIEAIEMRGYSLLYQGIANISGLLHLKSISFNGCKTFDDWCVDKISSEFPALEHLDLSECPKITERGLEALYKLLYLRSLIVTNHYDSAAFELTCFMLEDINPNLECIVQKVQIRSMEEQKGALQQTKDS